MSFKIENSVNVKTRMSIFKIRSPTYDSKSNYNFLRRCMYVSSVRSHKWLDQVVKSFMKSNIILLLGRV